MSILSLTAVPGLLIYKELIRVVKISTLTIDEVHFFSITSMIHG